MSQSIDQPLSSSLSSSTFSLSRFNVKKIKYDRKWNLGKNLSSCQGDHKTLKSIVAHPKETIIGNCLQLSNHDERKKKKRSRQEILASISANSRRKSSTSLPIPSFKLSNARLGELERAFFEDEMLEHDKTSLVGNNKKYVQSTEHTLKDSCSDNNKGNNGLGRLGDIAIADSDDEDDCILFSGVSSLHRMNPVSSSYNLDIPNKSSKESKVQTQNNIEMEEKVSLEASNLIRDGQPVEQASDAGQLALQSSLQPRRCVRKERRTIDNSIERIVQIDVIQNNDDGNAASAQVGDVMELAVNQSSQMKNLSECSKPHPDPLVANQNKIHIQIEKSSQSSSKGKGSKKKPGGEQTLVNDYPTNNKEQTVAKNPKTKSGNLRKIQDSSMLNAPTKLLASLEEPRPEALQGTTAPKAVRRYRKQCCALCKTCPCQKAPSFHMITPIDLNTFSRSGLAMEKALIRRIQKLEKSAESMEEQAEMVRRKLKTYRRETWKRSKRNSSDDDIPLGVEKDSQSYFLPDAEVFEQLHGGGQSLDDEMVREAQLRLFRDVPLQQITLTQMLGIGIVEAKNDTAAEAPDASPDNDDHAISETHLAADAHSGTDKPLDEEDDDEQSQYVKDRECDDTITRYHRNGAADDDSNETKDRVSLWDMIAPMTQDVEKVENAKALGKWDEMFATVEVCTEEGLDDLLNLFDEGNDHERLPKSPEEVERPDQQPSVVLSQGAQTEAQAIIDNVANRSNLLDRACPNWKENVEFALGQDDPGDVQEALENVQKSRRRMSRIRQQILDAWERQNAALDVFETALTTSAKRIKSKTNATNDSNDVGGFFTQESNG